VLIRSSLALVAALLLTAAPAYADYTVTGTGDGGGTCAGLSCPTLRAAVEAANATPSVDDTIRLGAAEYTLGSQLTVLDELAISGDSARTTAIRVLDTGRALQVNGDVTATVERVTIRGGRVNGDKGGNILNFGTLTLEQARVTDGLADEGGGIANLSGALRIHHSLVDDNVASQFSGGAILNSAALPSDPAPGSLTITHSTFAHNSASSTGGAISTEYLNTASIVYATFAYNSGGGRALVGKASMAASLLASNTGGACSSSGLTDGGFNLEDGTTCAFTAATSVKGVDPKLSGTLTNAGGGTDVYPIAEDSPARNRVTNCAGQTDQRGIVRGTPCDSGAYEYTPGDTVPPVTVTPGPSVTTTPRQTPTPTPGNGVAASPVSGKVLVKRPGSKTFVALDATEAIPLGSTVDTRDGVIELSDGSGHTARFFGGIFKITKSGATIDLTLTEALAKCPKRGAHAAAKKPKTRKLWGDGSGSFRTRGQYSAATIRGTRWLVQDSCAGTLTKVTKGVVAVRDNVKKRTIVLRAGRSYLAKPRR
jgi:predicted outer membrane repeat protein